MIDTAKKFAAHYHRDQKRKYTSDPYFYHLHEVAFLVEAVGGTPEMIAAAYLHDVVEDTCVKAYEVGMHFGPLVQRYVEDLTDISRPEHGNRAARKLIDRMHTEKACPEAKTIKLADLISNARSILRYDPDFAKVYMGEKYELMRVLRQGDWQLYQMAEFILKKYYK